MNKSRLWKVISSMFAFLLIVTAAGYGIAQGPNRYSQTNLVSDIANPPGGTPVTVDANLKNSWGIAHSPTGPWLVNDNATGVATAYNGGGAAFTPISSITPLTITIPPPAGGVGPASPTGIIFNGTKDFELAAGQPSNFMFVTEDGTISGWNPKTNITNAIRKVDNSAGGTGAVYKGAAMALNNGVLNIYVANFRAGTVEVYDTNFSPVAMAVDAFTDKDVPAGFAPFNVVNIEGKLFVTYAKQNAAKHDDVAGEGHGFVNLFNPDGTMVMRLKHGPWMDSPWGVARSRANFGKFSNHILVGNFGSGHIAAFDPGTGRFDGLLKNSKGRTLKIEGLWGLGFGNGATAGPVATLFFAAGINGEKDGLFGTLTPK